MNLPKEYHDMILEEFKKTEKYISETNIPEDKLYYFSSSFGIINRILNIHYDPLLIFIHQILQSVHQAIGQRLATRTGALATSCPDEMIVSLLSYLTELRTALEKNDDDEIKKSLEKFSILWYATSGNGFYLYLTKKLKLN